MGGRLQIVAAGLAVLSAFSGACRAELPASAGPSTAVPLAGGWTARFFVNPTDGKPGARLLDSTPHAGVNARFSRYIARGTSLSIDVSNLFEHPADRSAANGLLQPPKDGRGIGLVLKRTF